MDVCLQGSTTVGTARSETTDKIAEGNLDVDASLSDGSRTSESHRYQDTHRNILGESGDEDSDMDSDSSDYLSFEESDGEDVYPETKVEREARAHERQLVLEAAGLIVTQSDLKPPPSLRRRPAPSAPQKLSSDSPNKELPPVPQLTADPEPEPMDHAKRLDDAFERYESFKNSQNASNRMSMASTLSGEIFPPSPTISLTPSRERDSEARNYPNFLNFLGRSRTPEERSTSKLSISAPIMLGSGDSDPGRAGSSAFGSVRRHNSSKFIGTNYMPLISHGRAWLTRRHLMAYPQQSAADRRYVHRSYIRGSAADMRLLGNL
jgi:hypothetical protein